MSGTISIIRLMVLQIGLVGQRDRRDGTYQRQDKTSVRHRTYAAPLCVLGVAWHWYQSICGRPSMDSPIDDAQESGQSPP